tara:strand:- start:656 stop:1189 length:534 start_codon:yes stop_codon:yes gene_type:complete
MKFFFFLFILLLTISCGSNKGVYWCGDHPCINKKEKEAYFKKNMVVEMRSAKKTDYKNNSEIKQLMQEAEGKEKIRIKNDKSSSKQVRLEEKKLAKQIELEEKRQIKEEKKLAKQIKLEEKKQNKKKKKSSIKKIDGNNEKQLKKTEINLSEFSEIVEKITRKNAIKPYPDINDIAN